MQHITQIDLIIRLIIAAILGGVIGIERETANKPAGLRTYVLVSMGSAMFTLITLQAMEVWGDIGQYNPLEVIGSVLVGVGFIGGGVIMQEKHSVKNITTAASIWVAAGIGVATALGAYIAAGAAVIISLVALIGFGGLGGEDK